MKYLIFTFSFFVFFFILLFSPFKVGATCSDPNCFLIEGREICKPKSSTSPGCYTCYGEYPCYEGKIEPQRTCDLTPWGYPGQEGYAFWFARWSVACGTCCSGSGSPGAETVFNGLYRNLSGQRYAPSAQTQCSYRGGSLSCLGGTCDIFGWFPDGSGCHFDATSIGGTIRLSLTLPSEFDTCSWYINNNSTGSPTGERGTDCKNINFYNGYGWRYTRTLIMDMQTCSPKSCSFANVSDSSIADGINDSWCTSNEYQKCQFTHTGINSLTGQYNPSFWAGAACGLGQTSYLWGEKEVYADNISLYKVEGRALADDSAKIYVQSVSSPTASVSASNCVSASACASCGNSYCAGSWVNYQVSLPESNDYIMSVYLKHDAGCGSNLLRYNFYFGSDSYSYLAKRGNDSWEWANIDIGNRAAGTYNFGFSLDRDCNPPDLNAHVANTTIHGTNVHAFQFSKSVGLSPIYSSGWTSWLDITNQFKTGWNIVRFKAYDGCSADRYFNFDMSVTKSSNAPVCATSTATPSTIARCQTSTVSASGTDLDVPETITTVWNLASPLLPNSSCGVSGGQFTCSRVLVPSSTRSDTPYTLSFIPTVTDTYSHSSSCPQINVQVVNNLPSATRTTTLASSYYSGGVSLGTQRLRGAHPSPDAVCDYLNSATLRIVCPSVSSSTYNGTCTRSTSSDLCSFTGSNSVLTPVLPTSVPYETCNLQATVIDRYGATRTLNVGSFTLYNSAMTVSGTVYDKSGVSNCTAGGATSSGIPVVLTSPSGTCSPTQSTTTNSSGVYTFTNIRYCPAGNYTISLNLSGSYSDWTLKSCSSSQYRVIADGLSNLNFFVDYLPQNGWFQIEGGGDVSSFCSSCAPSTYGVNFAPPQSQYALDFYGRSQSSLYFVASYFPWRSVLLSRPAFGESVFQSSENRWLIDGYTTDNSKIASFSGGLFSYYDGLLRNVITAENTWDTLNELRASLIPSGSIFKITPSLGTLSISLPSSSNFNSKDIVFLVDGDVEFLTTFNPSDASVLFVSSGDIIINPSVGGALSGTSATPHIVAALLADGEIRTGSSFPSDDVQIKLNGTFISFGGFSLDRNLGVNSASINNRYPAELFSFNPRFYFYEFLSQLIGENYVSWKEI